MSPDSEEIESTVPKAHRRNFRSVEEIQDKSIKIRRVSWHTLEVWPAGLAAAEGR